MRYRHGFGSISDAEIRQADRFFADLVGAPLLRQRGRAYPQRYLPQAGESIVPESYMIEQASAPFQVRLTDPPEITAQARESKYNWAGDRVQIELARSGVRIAERVSPNGLFEIPSAGATQATLGSVHRAGTYRSTLRWRPVSGGQPAALRPGTPHAVQISSRLRLSIWTFVAPFTAGLTGDEVTLDEEQAQLLKDADVDDVSLVYTIGWDPRGSARGGPAKPPRWHPHFAPRGQTNERRRVNYLKRLIAALHPKVQVIAGFEIVSATGRANPTGVDFANWLASATPDDIRRYAQSINAFFEDRCIDVDGIGYDLEFDQLHERHRANLALLYQETSSAVAHHNGLVSYANAPFTEDSVYPHAFMRVQPFALAASAPNLLARPMCYDSHNSISPTAIQASIDCALRAPTDATTRGGAGLHPSQVQFGIWAEKVQGGVVDLCQKVLRPNRIGLIVYTLPGATEPAKAMLRNCKQWNAALNPGEGPAGQDAQPLQVPRGFGGWPPPFRGGRPAPGAPSSRGSEDASGEGFGDGSGDVPGSAGAEDFGGAGGEGIDGASGQG